MAPETPEHDQLVPMAEFATTDMEEVPAVTQKTCNRGKTLIVTMMFGAATYIAATRTSFGKEPTRVQAQPETMELDACSAPAVKHFSLPHLGCPTDDLTSSCLAENRNYNNFEDAWAACGTHSECGAIMEWTDGTFFLRRTSDPEFPIANAQSMLYSCSVGPKAGALAEAVSANLKSFADNLNAGDFVKAAAMYADSCDSKINEGQVFAGKNPEEMAGFLGKLHNDLGGTNLKLSITWFDGREREHMDIFVCDSGAGFCKGKWEEIGGEWKVKMDRISFKPKASGDNAGGVPTEVVLKAVQAYEDLYNANDIATGSADLWATAHDVTVNAGMVFASKTAGELEGFLRHFRNNLGGTNMRIIVTKVEGNVHEDVWVADNGAGLSKATWEEVEGQWKIVKGEVTFTPKALP